MSARADWRDVPAPLAKRCTKCKETKPFAAFAKHKGCAHGLRPTCRYCNSVAASVERERHREIINARHNKAHRAFRARKAIQDPHYGRRYNLMKKHGLTLATWDEIFESQGRACAICRAPKPGPKTKIWHTDHDHVTGRVRGILCLHCNRLLGAARDSADTLLSAIRYLENAV